jgi:flagella synthesis protein FlgN
MSAPPPLLERLAQELADYVAVLETEREVLGGSRLDGLNSVIADKTRHAEAASAAWNEAQVWLRSISTSGLNQGLEVPSDILPHWQSVVTLARQADQLNQRNGLLIDALLTRTRDALDVLQAAARPVQLYGADGQILDTPGHGHTLDKA